MDDRAERRSVRRSRQVVLDRLRNLLRRQAVAEPAEQAQQLLRRQQVEQHERIGLLGRLVVVHAVVFGFQDAIESLDVPVSLPVALPIQFVQFRIAFELADHLVVEGDEHPPRQVIPPIELVGRQIDFPDQIQPVTQR
jgi:hypothetical protein